MQLIDVIVKFRNTYAPLVAEDPRLLEIYTNTLKEFEEELKDPCLKNEILTDDMIMQYMMDECNFLEKVARIKMSRLA